MNEETVPTILVVDDEPAGRYATVRVLRAAGFAVLEAATGAEGLALAPRADLVLLDVHLPDIDGREVCRQLRARPATSRLRIVHLSGVYTDAPDKVRGLDAGADAYLTHPVEPPVLVATVKAQLRAALAEERASRLKDDFLAAISHELRTPLATILLEAKMLAAGRVPEADRAGALRRIVHSAQAQQRLVDDLLDTARIASGNLRLNLHDADLAAVVRSACEGIRPAAREKGIDLHCEQIGAEPVVTRIDPARLEQVLWNLLDNAVKFTPAGGRVSVALARGDDHAEVRVTDTGRGIAPEFLPHLFDRFAQAETGITGGTAGLGLGLAIARELVDLHGGALRAESAGPGRGATFTVRLPLAPRVG
jgi:signal transduction histidine kinase